MKKTEVEIQEDGDEFFLCDIYSDREWFGGHTLEEAIESARNMNFIAHYYSPLP